MAISRKVKIKRAAPKSEYYLDAESREGGRANSLYLQAESPRERAGTAVPAAGPQLMGCPHYWVTPRVHSRFSLASPRFEWIVLDLS